MTEIPKHIELKFYLTIIGEIPIEEFENWIYNDKEIESVLSEDYYLELVSFNYKKNGAKYELVNLLSEKYIDLGEYEKWKMLNKFRIALKRDENLPDILREFYDLYCRGYVFLNDLGLGYGLMVEVPPSANYKADSWEQMNEIEKKELIDSFYPQLDFDIKRAINWIEKGKIVLTGETDEIGHYEYEDLRTENERKSTVWTEVGRDDKTGFKAFESNLKILKEQEKRLTTIYKKHKWLSVLRKLFRI
ncbi:hypothetical protein [Marinifilum caeruleilacunae]|uniref:DUF4240 domain-containing protein n=1 Tax=Marinifilum caeruleilacunae TaxID=2499076 RepID=A0ABX1X1T2_9BACT|nr:hypothetical protein [Marinifilum caeruleilacunae]NOU62274.1 hypothetical protein [Marinifilum caeruleilacunae]